LYVLACRAEDDDDTDDDQADDDADDDDASDDDLVGDDDTEYVLYGLHSYFCSDPPDWPYCWDLYACRDFDCSLMVSQDSQAGIAWSIWASSPQDVFVVGGSRMIYHFNGLSWRRELKWSDESLFDIWGSDWNDVYAVGELHPEAWEHRGHIILHFNGYEWRQVKSGLDRSAYAVWGSSDSDVFVVGDNLILHYDGAEWVEMATTDYWHLISVWGSAHDDVFASGWDENEKALIVHYDGISWNKMTTNFPEDLWHVGSLWGFGPTDVYGAGDAYADSEYSLILHYDGKSWLEVWRLEEFFPSFTAIWGTTSSNIYVSGLTGLYHFDESTWSHVDGVPYLYDIYGVKL